MHGAAIALCHRSYVVLVLWSLEYDRMTHLEYDSMTHLEYSTGARYYGSTMHISMYGYMYMPTVLFCCVLRVRVYSKLVLQYA